MLFIGEQMGILGGSHLLDHKKTRGDYKMIKWLGFVLVLLPQASWAVTEVKPNVETLTIETNDLPKPSEAHVDRVPFFAETSTGNEVLDEVEILKDELNNLKTRVSALEKNSQKQ